MHISVIEFFIDNLNREEFQNKRVIEVGSKYVNGSVRPLIEKFGEPREYIGIDIEPGKYVDLVLPAENLVEHFGKASFDVVIATELLEHVMDWRNVINNMKAVLKEGGYMYITTRSKGFPFHAYPYDFWRYELEDMKQIFSDFEIIKLLKDPETTGVFLKAQKPNSWTPVDLSNVELYSMILGKRTKEVINWEKVPIKRRFKIKAIQILEYLGRLSKQTLIKMLE